MLSLRHLLLDRRRLVFLLALTALAVKLLVPSGFMVGVVDGRAMLQVCSGVMPVEPEPMAHMHHRTATHDDRQHPAAEMPCPYAALAQAADTPIDPLVLAVALAFALALGLRIVAGPRVTAAPHLRPPSRAPPILA
ncbi:DUF2946 family protein [Sphingomonas sp. CLY1604]|uniref:DUF2946 family protein n=1 Tax=Sphingomonas sp. CLY1604 TaxID=3457786 RepID=UPI003FD73CFA